MTRRGKQSRRQVARGVRDRDMQARILCHRLLIPYPMARKGSSALASLLLTVCFACSLVMVCDAAEVWFRPAGQPYGSGDGTSYRNAYSGIDTYPGESATSTKIAPGDTVHICGHHRGMLVVLDDNLTIDLACSAYQ